MKKLSFLLISYNLLILCQSVKYVFSYKKNIRKAKHCVEKYKNYFNFNVLCMFI